MENNQIRPRSSLSSISGNRSFNISSTSSLPPLYEEINNNSPSKTPPKMSLEVYRRILKKNDKIFFNNLSLLRIFQKPIQQRPQSEKITRHISSRDRRPSTSSVSTRADALPLSASEKRLQDSHSAMSDSLGKLGISSSTGIHS